MKNLFVSIVLAILAVPLGVQASAYEDPACVPEVKKYCAGMEGKALVRCMKNAFPDVSDACQNKIVEEAEAKGGCTADRFKFCGELMTGTVDGLEGSLLTCYLEHFDELAPACQNKVAKLEPCVDDIQNFCGPVEVGGGRITKCLLSNQRELTQGCATSIGVEQKSEK